MPTFALNFYSPVVADQLRTGRKTATIRLGDKSPKYKKGMIVTVLVGTRYGAREKIFDAVIDKVEVKPLRDVSPREIQHDVATLGAERHLDRVGKDVDTALERAPRVLVELELLVSHLCVYPFRRACC
jgi:hypothetical protein